MKTLLFIVILAFEINANAQITLENTYDSASNYNLESQLMIVNFEISGERYVRINKQGKNFNIYDMNHSLIKSISFANFPQTFNNKPTFFYLSESLFNTDTKIEFMYLYYEPNTIIANTRIYNEDGSLIFKADSMYPLISNNLTSIQSQFPIYNTSQGTKMILSHQFTGQAKVYNLPGTLSTSIAESNKNLLDASSMVSNAYPNPAINSTRIDYQLPDGINKGDIVFYDINGNEKKRFKVDRTSNSLLISTSDLVAGTYYYQLQTNTTQDSKGKKMVVIK